MRGRPLHAAFPLVLTLGLAAPAAAAQPTRCAISVAPGIGSTADSYRITGTGFPPGRWASFTDVHIGVGRAGDGRIMPTLFNTLFPDGSSRKHYHARESVGIACGLFVAAVHQMGLVTLTHTLHRRWVS